MESWDFKWALHLSYFFTSPLIIDPPEIFMYNNCVDIISHNYLKGDFMSIFKSVKKSAMKTVGLVVNRLSQNEAGSNTAYEKTVTEGMPELLRQAGAEGTVLLRNDGVLPFKKEQKISIFGRVQNDYMYVGYGSGGDVIKPYTVSLAEGFKNSGLTVNEGLAHIYKQWCEENAPDHGFWGHWPYCYEEMPVDGAFVEKAAKESDCAVVVIGRAAGEDRENTLTEGSYYLTKDEKNLIELVSKNFEKTAIVLNVGNIIDMSWEEEVLTNQTAIFIPWQGGMESGSALCDVLSGKVEPSGRLTDTIAKAYEDYPSAESFGNKEFNNYTEDIFVGYRYFETFKKDSVRYPFGFGLGYARFKREFVKAEETPEGIILKVKTENISDYLGKDVLEIFAECPQGLLGKPARVLVEFEKSKCLKKGESEEFTFLIPYYSFASYDGSGAAGNPCSYILEKGEYGFYLGGDVRNAEKIWAYTEEETRVISTLSQITPAQIPFERLAAREKEGVIVPSKELTPECKVNLKKEILENLPKGAKYTGDLGFKLSDVKAKKCTMEDFVSQLSPAELEAISRGDYTMDSALGNKGNAGALGGVTESLRKKGVAPIITTDGPSGIRIKSTCSLLPNGTCLASMWNKALVRDIYEKVGSEMMEKGSDMLLAPGMNIHRNPLCGRNFEYYSEDPFVTGKTAAAAVSGLQKNSVSACPKHFACNNQETNRNRNDSRLSERALREIYLKGFEICVKEAQPLAIMTSYNKINGVWAHYNYELCTKVLRGEWGYGGVVITDWWMQYAQSPEFPNIKDNAYRVRAGVDVLMPGGKRTGRKKPDGTLLKTYGKPDGILLGEMQRTAEKVLRLVIKLKM